MNKINEISELKELELQIRNMLNNKKNFSKPYSIPENISTKAKAALIDLENNHDNSFPVEMFLHNIDSLDNINISYRGRKITGYEFWKNVVIYAKSLKALGIHKGYEVPLMMTNSPEYFYMLIALILIGAKVNIVGTWFDKEYLKEIFTNSKSKFIFVTDDINESIVYAINNSDNIEHVYMSSLTDSFLRDKDGNKFNPYAAFDMAFGHFSTSIEDYRGSITKELSSFAEFTSKSAEFNGQFVEDMCLDDACAITYTSGTTKPGFPKGCIHSNRNYLSIARFKKSDVAPMPSMKNITVLAHAPSYTQTVITTAYTDPLYMGWTTAIEPYYDLEFYPYSLLINKPNYTVESPEYEKYLAKLLDTTWKNINMPERVAICVAGQELSPGLEKYLNRIAREHKFGTARLPFPLAPVTVSIAGGTTENGGYLSTLFKGLQEKKLGHLIRKDPMLLESIGLADTAVIDPDTGRRCGPYERGMHVINAPTNQIGYVEEKFNEGTTIVDEFGKEWRTTGTPGYKDRYGNLRYLDRPNTDIITKNGCTPLYWILDLIKKDTKNIMEAYLVKVDVDGTEKYVVHIERQPDARLNEARTIEQIRGRLVGQIDPDILNNMFFRFRSFEEGFPVAGTGKTDMFALRNEGLDPDKCYSFIEPGEMVKSSGQNNILLTRKYSV